MQKPNTAFKKTYQDYLERVLQKDLSQIGPRLGVKDTEQMTIPFFNNTYTITNEGVKDKDGRKAGYDVCIVLFKYILLCPDTPSSNKEMVAFRDFKDSGPLFVYFANEVENKISKTFSLHLDDLKKAAKTLKGYQPDIQASYDLIVQFDALPKIRLALLFNDKDREFDAQAKILFEKRAQDHLDAECLAIMGNLLFRRINEAMPALKIH